MNKRRSLFTADAQSLIARTWRPVVELPAAMIWCAAAVYALVCSAPLSISRALLAVSIVMGLRRLHSAFVVLRARALLAGRAPGFHSTESLARRVRRSFKPRSLVWFGKGFDWTPEHSQKLYELSRVDISRMVPAAALRRILVRAPAPQPGAIGLAAIDGLEKELSDITVSDKTLEGGTLIVGTTQAGKGVLLTNLVTQAIVRGDTVIIVDPKMSSRLKDAAAAACRSAGRCEPAFFHPNAEHGIRLNPLEHFERASELASRITAVMSEDGPFTAFAWSAVNMVCNLLLACGQKPTLADIESVLNGALEAKLAEALRKSWGENRFELCKTDAHSRGLRGRELMLDILKNWRQSSDLNPAIEAAAAVYGHDPLHYAKITASLMPVLGMLTSGSLRSSLSPGAENDNDPRPAASLTDILDKKGVLYVCLNSLPDPMVASAIGSILLADLASCAGNRYNNPDIERNTVWLFVDECSNVMNKSLIEILNKGAESGIRTTAAMQTVSDLAARLGSADEARMALGNFNTLVALRTKDRFTQNFVTETFGRTYIANHGATLTTSSDSLQAGSFSASYSRQLSGERDDLIPPEMLGRLPNCEFFASIAGGRIVKGRIPILSSTRQ